MLPKGIPPQDSVSMVKEYIEKWAKNLVILENSRDILKENELLDIEQKVEQYRNDLLIDQIEIHWLSSDSLNSIPSESELKKYYENYKDSFIADNNFVEYRFIKVPKEKAYTTRKLLLDNSPEANNALEKLAQENEYKAELKKNQWIEFHNLSKIIPLLKNAPPSIYLQKQIFNFPENDSYFMLQITDFAKNGQKKPFSLVKNQIQSIVINKRKLNLLSDKKNELYEKALYNDEIKIN